MSTNVSAAYGLFPFSIAVSEVVQILNRGGFAPQSVCMMLSPTHPIATIVRESNSHPYEKPESAVMAGLIRWLSEFGAVVIPTFGFFIHSQKFLQALVIERDSIAGCGNRGTLASLGFSNEDAERFEDQMQEGGALLYVSCPKTGQTKLAFELLRASGAHEAGLLESETAIATATCAMATNA